MLSLQNILFLLAVLLTALIAGLFYGWACSVIPGTATLSDQDYLKAMKSMNRGILNPWFFLSFIGTLIILPVCTWYAYQNCSTTCFHFMMAASLLYIIGGFGLTMVCNVPLNDALDVFDLTSADPAGMAAKRNAFELPWNRYHLVRTVACIGSLICTILAILKK